MKKISLTFVTAMLFFTGSILGQSPDKSNLDKELERQIEEILDGHYKRPNKDVIAKILFIVNNEHEIVVLEVETDNRDFERYIKKKLNYKEVESDETPGIANKFIVQVRLLS